MHLHHGPANVSTKYKIDITTHVQLSAAWAPEITHVSMLVQLTKFVSGLQQMDNHPCDMPRVRPIDIVPMYFAVRNSIECGLFISPCQTHPSPRQQLHRTHTPPSAQYLQPAHTRGLVPTPKCCSSKSSPTPRTRQSSHTYMGFKLLYAGFETCVAPSTKSAGTKTHLKSRCCALLIYRV